MRVIDADGHVEENLETFSDKYFEPAFRSLRPRVTGMDGLAYWVIDEQLYPRRVGPGCHNLGTPTNYDGKVAAHITAPALTFPDWGTQRSSWRESDVTVTGDTQLAARFLDAVNVI